MRSPPSLHQNISFLLRASTHLQQARVMASAWPQWHLHTCQTSLLYTRSRAERGLLLVYSKTQRTPTKHDINAHIHDEGSPNRVTSLQYTPFISKQPRKVVCSSQLRPFFQPARHAFFVDFEGEKAGPSDFKNTRWRKLIPKTPRVKLDKSLT